VSSVISEQISSLALFLTTINAGCWVDTKNCPRWAYYPNAWSLRAL